MPLLSAALLVILYFVSSLAPWMLQRKPKQLTSTQQDWNIYEGENAWNRSQSYPITRLWATYPTQAKEQQRERCKAHCFSLASPIHAFLLLFCVLNASHHTNRQVTLQRPALWISINFDWNLSLCLLGRQWTKNQESEAWKLSANEKAKKIPHASFLLVRDTIWLFWVVGTGIT